MPAICSSLTGMCTVAESLSSTLEAGFERLGSGANSFRGRISISRKDTKYAEAKLQDHYHELRKFLQPSCLYTGALARLPRWKFLAAYLRVIQTSGPTSKRNLMTQPCLSTSLSNSSVHSALLSSLSRAARQFAYSWTIAAMSGTKVSGSGPYFCGSRQSRERSVSTSIWYPTLVTYSARAEMAFSQEHWGFPIDHVSLHELSMVSTFVSI